MKKIKYILLLLVTITFQIQLVAQNNKAKTLLDEVSTKMSAYSNMEIGFNSSLSNEEAGIAEGDEPPIAGSITLQQEKYNLNYLDNNFIFNGSKLYIINHEEKEISINQGDFEESDGFIYPSKLLTFYKEGYTFSMGKLKTVKGKKIQIVELTPIDSESEIVKVFLGIDLSTKHIYNMTQVGANTSKTTITITSFKSNQELPTSLFSFDRKAYEKDNYIID